MLVIAKELGVVNGSRVRPGTEFDLPESMMKKGKDGEPVLPRWVVPATAHDAAKVRADAADTEGRMRRAVEAAAGPKRHGRVAVKPTDPNEV